MQRLDRAKLLRGGATAAGREGSSRRSFSVQPMSAKIIDGREVAARVRAEVAREVAASVARGERTPGLATILVGEDPGSQIYVANKRRASSEVGITDRHRHLPAESSQDEVAERSEERRVGKECRNQRWAD